MRRVLMATGMSIVLMGVLLDDLLAQGYGFCRISYSALNKDRKVMGPVSAECPGGGHSVPFGNWGVTSNVGHKVDGHQFDGWCKDHYVCDNSGNCKTHCTTDAIQIFKRTRWYQWNSCTTYAQWRPRNCTLYNSNNCTQQVTTRGVNTHGTTVSDIYVSCPTDTNGDGVCDAGGCSDVNSFTTSNWMTLYELDPGRDELIQSLYFPSVTIRPACDIMSCDPDTSSWVSPNRYDTPRSPALVNAKAAVKVHEGRFVDRDGLCARWAERGAPGYDCR